MKANGNSFVKKFITYLFLISAVAVSIYPFIWMLVGATNTSTDVTSGIMKIGDQFINNWNNLKEVGQILIVFFNTAKVTLSYTFISILICSLAGYGFEKYRSKGKNVVYALFLLSMMIPFSSQIIPLFRMFSAANMLDSHFAVIAPTLALPFLVFFFRQSFQAYPNELIEAARVDGAGEFKIFFKLVFLPMKSTFAAGAIYAFMKQWNNYLWPLIVIQSNKKKTFTLFLSSLSSAYYVDYGQLMLAIVISTIPIIIVFLTMQKQFVEGIVGSSK